MHECLHSFAGPLIAGIVFILSLKRSIQLGEQELDAKLNLVELKKEINEKLHAILAELKRTSEPGPSSFS